MKSLLFLCSFLLLALVSSAQDKQNFTFTIDSEAFGKERKVHVFLPERYLNNNVDSFAVTYVLDAHSESLWGMVKHNVNYLVNNYQTIPMIAVGIHTENRHNEFIPLPRDTTDVHPSNRNGTAHLLRKHLEEEVFPLIESKYRTTSFRSIIGHSRGGFFVGETLFSDKHDMFDGYIAISPAFHYLNNQLLNDADYILQSQEDIKKFFFCSIGDVGSLEHYFDPIVARLDSSIKAQPNPTLSWHLRKLPGTSHWSGVIPAINYGLVEMTRAYSIDQIHIEKFAHNEGQSIKSQIDDFYKKVGASLGQCIIPDAPSIKYYGDELREDGMSERVLEVFDWAIAVDPDYMRAYRSKGWLLSDLDRKDEAKASFEMALEKLEKQKADHKPEDFERMKKGIERTIKDLGE